MGLFPHAGCGIIPAMRNAIWRVPAAVILAVGVGSSVGLAASSRVYQNQQWRFHVAAPEKWFVTPAEDALLARYAASGLVVVFSESSLARAKGLNPNCTISVERLPEAARGMSKEQLLAHVQGVIGPSKDMKIRSGLRELSRTDCLAAQVEYEFQQQLGPSAVPLVARVIALVSPAKTHCVVITATAPAGSFNSYAAAFDQVASSFAFASATP